jgi:hypothetical protein
MQSKTDGQKAQLQDFYTNQILGMTLEKAIEEHYKVNPQFTRYDEFETIEGGNLIKSHDISHIIYGCNTSYMGEFKVQMWNNYGSTNTNPKIPFKTVKSKDFKIILQLVLPTSLFSYAFWHVREFASFWNTIRKQTKNMSKKWVYGDEEKYMKKTIAEIRQEYNILIID